jgi:lipopolysaccharide/colanic/teichoic acid biosynthesis glycosyltransferase
MCINADEKLEQLLSTDAKLKEEWSNDHKLKNDPRVTKVGKIMRALSLDELPQIFNVLRGEMSFVGPRPIVEEEIRKYNNNFSAYKSIRPGITGLWQINGRNDTDYSIRVKMDTTYAGSLNYFSDMAILFKTIPAILSTRGAY